MAKRPFRKNVNNLRSQQHRQQQQQQQQRSNHNGNKNNNKRGGISGTTSLRMIRLLVALILAVGGAFHTIRKAILLTTISRGVGEGGDANNNKHNNDHVDQSSSTASSSSSAAAAATITTTSTKNTVHEQLPPPPPPPPPPTLPSQQKQQDNNNNDAKYRNYLEEEEIHELNKRPIHFFGPTLHLNDRIDAFSASWLQSVANFRLMNYTEILSCEDAAFLAYWGQNVNKLQMTVDWFDFAIEHMSKWHKLLQIYDDDQSFIYETALSKFDTYMSLKKSKSKTNNNQQNHAVLDPPPPPPSTFQETIAVIAFQPYTHPTAHDKAYQLTIRSLGATLESLRRAGFGRVVVVSLDTGIDDLLLVHKTIEHLLRQLDIPPYPPNLRPKATSAMVMGIMGKVGQMEVSYARGSLEIAKAKWVQKNVPKAALGGLWEAFQLAEKKKSTAAAATLTQSELQYIQTWLGNNNNSGDNNNDDPLQKWKYVYLTEPDCILQTRPTSLQQLKEQVDMGMVLAPHRLQPIPHASDAAAAAAVGVGGSSSTSNNKDWLFLPLDFPQPVQELDPIGQHDVCCDDWKGHGTKPGLPPMFPDCGNFWYQCDFVPPPTKDGSGSQETRHQRLKPYGLMRLKQGTGIVSLAGSEHGRPCKPQKRSFCPPKT